MPYLSRARGLGPADAQGRRLPDAHLRGGVHGAGHGATASPVVAVLDPLRKAMEKPRKNMEKPWKKPGNSRIFWKDMEVL